MKFLLFLFGLFAIILAGCQTVTAPEQSVSMPDLPFHVNLNEQWSLAEDDVIYSWTFGIALDGGVVFVKKAVEGELANLVDEDSEVYSNADGSIVSFCDSGRCLISIDGREDRYWATIKDDGLPLVRGERAIEYIFDNLEMD